MCTLAADAFASLSQEVDGRNLRVETRAAPGERKPFEAREPRMGGGEMRPRRPMVRGFALMPRRQAGRPRARSLAPAAHARADRR